MFINANLPHGVHMFSQIRRGNEKFVHKGAAYTPVFTVNYLPKKLKDV